MRRSLVHKFTGVFEPEFHLAAVQEIVDRGNTQNPGKVFPSVQQ
jgi:hypothetical protein